MTSDMLARLGLAEGRVAKARCPALGVLVSGQGELGQGRVGYMVPVQIECRAEWPGGFGWTRVPHHLPCPRFLLFQMFSSQQTFTEHLLCTRYVLGAWRSRCGKQK